MQFMPHNKHVDGEILITHHWYYAGSSSKRVPVCPAYCDCDFPTTTAVTCFKGPIAQLIKCRCGEDEAATHTLYWNWHQCAATDALINGPDITFHPTYSSGTAMVRGETPLAPNMVHFWEMRVLTVLSGTDVMFGIGTDKFDQTQYKFNFLSALGTNSQSWGLSYEGKIHHNGVHLRYGQKFSQGCIVGVLLDRVHGKLEFFLNRRSLGVAYTNIPNGPNVKMFPMVCSTAAKSCIRLINATSQSESLQLRAFRALAKQPKALEELKQLPGLRAILNKYWFFAPPIRYSRESKSKEYDMLDEAVLSSKSRLSGKHKYKDDDADDLTDLYSNAHKIAAHRQNESDNELVLNDYFEEYFHYLF